MDKELLNIKDLFAFYGSSKVVRGISASFERGETYGLIGRIGAGKTTTFKSILGMVKNKGVLNFDGKDISQMPTYERIKMGWGYVPENRDLYGEMTVLENLETGRRNNPEEFSTIYDIFPRLEERSSLKAKSLSGGEQQMLAIARALMNSPRLILMDEPFEGLAKPIIENLYEVLRDLIGGERIFIFAGNDFELLKPVVDNYLFIERGEVVFRGNTQEVEEEYLDGND